MRLMKMRLRYVGLGQAYGRRPDALGSACVRAAIGMDRPGGLSYLGHDVEQLLLHFVAHLKHLGVGLKLISSGEQGDRFGAEVDGIRRLYGSDWLGCLV